MNVKEGSGAFTKLFPNMMRSTRMLLIDHDVTRYHSFDLVRYELYKSRELFGTLKQEYRPLVKSDTEMVDVIHFMKTKVSEFNIFDMFNPNPGISSMEDYSARIARMLRDPVAKATPTDVDSRFDVVFDRPGIDGYILQYAGDTNKPSCYNQITAYESNILLDLQMAIKIILKHRINAVMMCNTQLAIELTKALIEAGYTDEITYIIATFGYNYEFSNGSRVGIAHKNELIDLTLKYRHEYSFFDPYSGVSYMYQQKEAAT